MMLEAPLEAPLEAHLESPEAPPPDLRSRLMMLEAPLEARPRVASRRHPATSGVDWKCSSAFSKESRMAGLSTHRYSAKHAPS